VVNSTGTYWCSVFNTSGCSATDTVLITRGFPPTVNLGPDQAICNGQTVTLNAGNPGSTYFWSNNATTQSITVTNPGYYIVTVTSPTGCPGYDTVQVLGTSLTVNLGPDLVLCGGNQAVLDAGNPGFSYLWNTGATSQVIVVSNPGAYSVSVTDIFGCSGSDQIQVSNVAGITAAFTSPATGTLSIPVQFTDQSAPGAVSWSWDFGDGNNSSIQNPANSYSAFGIYTVTLVAGDGACFDTTTRQVNINGFIATDPGRFPGSLKVYPNPAADIFFLELDLFSGEMIEFNVSDLNGKVLLNGQPGQFMNWKGSLDMSEFPVGLYILEVRAGESSLSARISVQR